MANLIIVANTDLEKGIGQKLMNALNANNDYEALFWDIKIFGKNKEKIMSSQKIIYIGKNKISKNYFNSVDWKFNDLHMKYGWSGQIVIMDVEDKFLSKKEASKFKKSLEELKLAYNSKYVNLSVASNISAVATVLGVVSAFNPATWIVTGISGLLTVFTKLANRGILNQQKNLQYNYLLTKFLLDDFELFMS
jgi:hypothetical protein